MPLITRLFHPKIFRIRFSRYKEYPTYYWRIEHIKEPWCVIQLQSPYGEFNLHYNGR